MELFGRCEASNMTSYYSQLDKKPDSLDGSLAWSSDVIQDHIHDDLSGDQGRAEASKRGCQHGTQ